MAKALKLIKTRVSKLMQSVLELHGLGENDEEAAALLACIQVAQNAQLEINQMINQYEAVKRGKPLPVISYPAGLQPPVYGKQTGVIESLPKQPKNWAARAMPVGAAGLRPSEAPAYAPIPALVSASPEELKKARDFVRECEIEGDHASYYNCIAYNELSRMPAWKNMDACGQAGAIRARSDELAATDTDEGMDSDDVRYAPPVQAKPVVKPDELDQSDGVVF